MLCLDCLDEEINRYYDNELSENELFAIEARMYKSEYTKEYIDKKFTEFSAITRSITSVKKYLYESAEEVVLNLYKKL